MLLKLSGLLNFFVYLLILIKLLTKIHQKSESPFNDGYFVDAIGYLLLFLISTINKLVKCKTKKL